jgi:3-oxoacyl-[acyl-carrier protein] reductase
MDLGLKGKVALVTASSKGLGKACAMSFAQEGADVAICSRSLDESNRAAAEIRQATGREVLAVQADVADAADIARFVHAAAENFGRIDALVCNAGGPPSGTFLSLSDEDWDKAVQLNLMSVVRLIRAAHPYLAASGSGRIVNMSSMSIKQPIPGLLLSNTIRLGLQGLVKTLSDEFAEQRILVNTVAPGRFDTDRIRSLNESKAKKDNMPVEQVKQQSESEIPLGRYGSPEEFARYVVFLASPANTYVTGQALVADGGLLRGV